MSTFVELENATRRIRELEAEVVELRAVRASCTHRSPGGHLSCVRTGEHSTHVYVHESAAPDLKAG